MKILFVDVGNVYIGIASCNEAEDNVSAHDEISMAGDAAKSIITAAHSYGASHIVVGRHNLNGITTSLTSMAETVYRKLSKTVPGDLTTELWNEEKTDISTIKNDSSTFGPHSASALSSAGAVYLLRCYLALKKASGKK